jgi:hypothetical protein
MKRPTLEELRAQHAVMKPTFYRIVFTTEVVAVAMDEPMAFCAANTVELGDGDWDCHTGSVFNHHTFLDEEKWRTAHCVVAPELAKMYPDMEGMDADEIAAHLKAQEPKRCQYTLDLFDDPVESNPDAGPGPRGSDDPGVRMVDT